MELYEVLPLPSSKLKRSNPLYWVRVFLFAYIVVQLCLLASTSVEAGDNSDRIADFTGDTADGHYQKASGIYNVAWTASDADSVSDEASTLSLGQREYLSINYIWRVCLAFDTSTIDDGENVTAAWVQVTIYGDYSDTDFSFTVQVGSTGHPAVPLVVGDYDKSLYTGTEVWLSTNGIIVDGRYSFPIPASLVNKTSSTLVLVRSSRDVAGIDPAANEFVSLYSSDHGTADYHPKLTVVYNSTYAVMATNGSDSKDGTIYKQDPVFLTAWNSPTGTVQGGHATVGYNEISTQHRIDRGTLFIDTDDLPDDLNLTRYNATLLVYVSHFDNVQDFSVYVQNGQPTYPHDPRVPGDYAKANYAGGISGGHTVNTSDMDILEWYDIRITTSWVTLDGQTKLMLRSDRDIYGMDFAVDSWLTVLGDLIPCHAYRLVLDYIYEAPEPPEEPPGGDEESLLESIMWDNVCISNWAFLIAIVLIAVGIIGLAGRVM